MDIRAVSFLGGHLDGLAHEESSILGAYLPSSNSRYNVYQMQNNVYEFSIRSVKRMHFCIASTNRSSMCSSFDS